MSIMQFTEIVYYLPPSYYIDLPLSLKASSYTNVTFLRKINLKVFHWPELQRSSVENNIYCTKGKTYKNPLSKKKLFYNK